MREDEDGSLNCFAVNALKINGASMLGGDPRSDGVEAIVRSASVELLTYDARSDMVTISLRNGTTIEVAGHEHEVYEELATSIFGHAD